MTNKIRHPAKFTDIFIPTFANLLVGYKRVLDPFAGTGKLALIKDYGYKGEVVCVEIEPEWTDMEAYDIDEWRIGDSQDMYWAEDNSFDAICTSPSYGNRMADHFESKDDSRRITYRHYLGRPLNENNSGRMQWGEKYRTLHRNVYKECRRVLRHEGLFILNISNHIRKGMEVDVTMWHKQMLKRLDFELIDKFEIPTPRHRYGANYKKRVAFESILVFKLDKVDE